MLKTPAERAAAFQQEWRKRAGGYQPVTDTGVNIDVGKYAGVSPSIDFDINAPQLGAEGSIINPLTQRQIEMSATEDIYTQLTNPQRYATGMLPGLWSGLSYFEKGMRIPAAVMATEIQKAGRDWDKYGFWGSANVSLGEVVDRLVRGKEIPFIQQALLERVQPTQEGLMRKGQWTWPAQWGVGLVASAAGFGIDMVTHPITWVLGGAGKLPLYGGTALKAAGKQAAAKTVKTAMASGLLNTKTAQRGATGILADLVTFAENPQFYKGQLAKEAIVPSEIVAGHLPSVAMTRMKQMLSRTTRLDLSPSEASSLVDTFFTHLQDLSKSQLRLRVPFVGQWRPTVKLRSGFQTPTTAQAGYDKATGKIYRELNGIYEYMFPIGSPMRTAHTHGDRLAHLDTIAEWLVDPSKVSVEAGFSRDIVSKVRAAKSSIEKTIRPLGNVSRAVGSDVQQLAGQSAIVEQRLVAYLQHPLRNLRYGEMDIAQQYLSESPIELVGNMKTRTLDEPSKMLATIFEIANGKKYGIGDKIGFGARKRVMNVINRTGEWDNLPTPGPQKLWLLNKVFSTKGVAPKNIFRIAGQKYNVAGVERVLETPTTINMDAVPKQARKILRAAEEYMATMRKYGWDTVNKHVTTLQESGLPIDMPGDLGMSYFHKVTMGRQAAMKVGRTVVPSEFQSILKESTYRSPVASTMLSDIVHDPRAVLDIVNTPEIAEVLNNLDSIPTFARDLRLSTRAYARQVGNLNRVVGMRRLVAEKGVIGEGGAADKVMKLRQYFDDMPQVFPAAAEEFLDRVGVPYSKELGDWRRLLSFPRRAALFTTMFIKANLIDQLPSMFLSGVTRPKVWNKAFRVALNAMTHDTAKLAEISGPQTFMEHGRAAIVARLRDFCALGPNEHAALGALDDLLTTNILGTGMMQNLERDVGTGVKGIGDKIFDNTFGIGVRVGGAMEDFTRGAQFIAMRLDGLSKKAAIDRITAGFVPYAREYQSVIDEYMKTFSYFWTYKRHRIPQYAESMLTRPWVTWMQTQYARSKMSGDNEQDPILWRARPFFMWENPDYVQSSWSDWPLSYYMNEMFGGEEQAWVKENIMGTIRPRMSFNETMGDMNQFAHIDTLIRGKGISGPSVYDILSQADPATQLFFNLSSKNYERAMNTAFPPMRTLLAEWKLKHEPFEEETEKKRWKKYGMSKQYKELQEDPEALDEFDFINKILVKLEVIRQAPRMPRLKGMMASGTILSFLNREQLASNLEWYDYAELNKLRLEQGLPPRMPSQKQRVGIDTWRREQELPKIDWRRVNKAMREGTFPTEFPETIAE